MESLWLPPNPSDTARAASGLSSSPFLKLSCDLFLMRILGRGGVLMGEEGIPEWMFDVELDRCECVTERELVWREESALTAAGRTGPA